MQGTDRGWKGANKGCIMKPVTTAGNQILILCGKALAMILKHTFQNPPSQEARAVVLIPPPLVNSQALPASRGWAKYVLASQEQPFNEDMLEVHQHSS